jgi:hypothetical protein
VTRPISATLVALIAIFMLWQLVAFFQKTRKVAAPLIPAPID